VNEMVIVFQCRNSACAVETGAAHLELDVNKPPPADLSCTHCRGPVTEIWRGTKAEYEYLGGFLWFAGIGSGREGGPE
jgi:hypothetical protein